MTKTRLLAIAALLLGCAAKPAADGSSPATTSGAESGDDSSSSAAEVTGSGSSEGSSTEGSSTSSGSSSESTGAAACGAPPPACAELQASTRVDVTTTDAAPYLIREQADPNTPADIILFMPGGPGAAAQAPITFDLWLAEGEGIDDFLVVMPYSAAGNLPGEPEHVFAVLDEVQSCYCNTGRVHLGGTSNGGRLAYRLALEQPARFVTLLGAPGTFDDPDPAILGKAMAGKRVFNAVGELDTAWQPNVEATHQALLDAGIDSTLYIMPGQEHILNEAFDESAFFEFWSAQ